MLWLGGTALSLMYGHRVSIDLDLFSNNPLPNEIIIEVLKNKFKERFECECGSQYTRYNKSRHLKSNKHLNYLESLK